MLVNRVPLPKSPAALQDRAEEALAALGVNLSEIAHSASGVGLL